MASTAKPTYGTPNWSMISRWLEIPAEDDGPFWALNLMKYRTVAAYGNDAGSDGKVVSGREADDAYAPLGPLAAIGAMVSFLGDVDSQPLGEPGWDRIGIIRYPSRAAFFAMQQRDDFKQQHVHKEAGMEFTIVMATIPTWHADAPATEGRLVLTVERQAQATMSATPTTGIDPIATFDLEGVIVGDERTFDRVRFDRVADDEALSALVNLSAAAEESQVIVLDVKIDNLIESIRTAPSSKQN